MSRPIELAVRRKVATSAIAVALVVLGVLSLTRLPVDFLPDIAYPLIKVHVWWRGATPEEIEENVAEVIEREMAAAEGLDYLASSSIEGGYTLRVNFQYGVDVNVAFQDVQAAMARAARRLPPDMDAPVVIKADPQQLPVVQLTVQSAQWDLVQIRDWSENWLLDRVLAVPGVAGAEIAGGLKREIRIHLDPGALDKHALSVEQVRHALAEANVEMFGGRVYAGPRELIARTMGELGSLDQIRAVVVAERDAVPITLTDVATVADAHEEVRIITRLDGQPCVKLSVQKQPDANTVAVARALDRRLAEIGSTIPDHVALGMVESQADYVTDALSGVEAAAGQAAVLVIVITFLFLGSLRQVLVLLTALPVTLVANFGLMLLGGFSVNIFTLAGIVIALGVLLDSSIVVLENISRRRAAGGGGLRWRYAVVLLFAALATVAALRVPALGSEFLPRLDDGRVMIKVMLPSGTSLQQTDRLMRRIEATIADEPAIESAFSLVGGKIWGLYTFEVAYEGEIDIQLVPRAERRVSTRGFMRRLKKKLGRLAPPGGKVMVRQMRIKGIRKMGRSDIEIQVRGPNIERLFGMAQQVIRTARANPHLSNVHLGMDLTKPELQVRIDRTRARVLGVSVAAVARALRAWMHGVVASLYQEGEEHYAIRLRLPEARLDSKRVVENLRVPAAGGRHVRLRDVAAVERGSGPVEIAREDQVKQVVVGTDAAGASVGRALGELKAALAELELPPGYEIDYGGKARLMQDLTDTAVQILALAVFLALVVLAVQFNSARYPLIILACIPVSAAGMVFALDATGLAMGATVLIGLLVVVAATVNDGVLLFTLADELRRAPEALAPHAAVQQAARLRLRPRVMTTATTVAGLAPLALNVGAGGGMLQPMAVAAIGGLLFEIPVGLFLMPCLYVMIHRRTATAHAGRQDTG